MNYLIVDDEPLAHEVLEDMCADLPFMVLKGKCYGALEALNILEQEAIDVIFLDVHMPKMGGFEFLRTLKHKPHVIAISADRDYALEGFDLNIDDYLLKPFTFTRLLQAVNKVRAKLMAIPVKQETFIFKDGKKHHQVMLDDVLFIEACGNYCQVHLRDSHLLTHEKMGDLAARLPDGFLRIHKSFIVARKKIKLITGGEVHLPTRSIPIGRVYKAQVAKILRGDT